MSFYYIEIETKGYYMGEIVKQNSKLKPRCCLLRGKCCKYSSDIEAAKAAGEIITKCRIKGSVCMRRAGEINLNVAAAR